jgi:hypothetical protein
MHGGSHEVYKPGQDFEPTQWYLLQTARWVLKHASKVENYNADWDIVAECKTEAEVVDELREKGILKFDAAIAHFQAYVELVGEQRRSVQNEVF